jgi:hypothetical protein
MAVTSLSQALHDLWVGRMPGESPAGATLRTGLVSDLVASDYLMGARVLVVSTGATVSGNRTLTVKRHNVGVNFDIVLPAASTLWFTRV